MKYYSTNHTAPTASLKEAVERGLAPDKGLYMPEHIKQLPKEFFNNIQNLSFQEIARQVAEAFFGEDIAPEDLRRIVDDTLTFDCPVVKVEDNIYALELFHGPTLAFKDVGARFMARLLSLINSQGVKELRSEGVQTIVSPFNSSTRQLVNVLVATSGDTGSAVANGFLGVDGIHVYVLYPKGKVSAIQECQFTTLGQNITAIEVDGVFDDCQRLVKTAFMDEELNRRMTLTSANSINVARFLPQAFYYFNAVARIREEGVQEFRSSGVQDDSTVNRQPSTVNPISPQSGGLEGGIVISVPSGNFGNLCAGLFAHTMGLPVSRFIAANNANDVFYNYLQTGRYEPKPSLQTIANAMDVGDPSNFARIVELYNTQGVKEFGSEGVQEFGSSRSSGVQVLPPVGGIRGGLPSFITGATYTDDEIRQTMRQCYERTGYILDPHGACGYQALRDQLRPGEIGIFCETAHPAKFKQTVDETLGIDLPIPDRLAAFMSGQKQAISLSARFEDFKQLLLNTLE